MALIRIMGFQGEVPRVHPRLLPDRNAQRAQNVKLERGILSPYRRPQPVRTLTQNAKTIYRSGDDWLSWNAVVEVVPGPVAADRLYITGDGAPKVRAGGTTYSLAVPAPAAKPVAALRTAVEFFSVGNVEVSLQNGRTATTSGGWNVAVTVVGDKATISITHPTGGSAANTAALIDGFRFRHGVSKTVPSLKVIRITKIQDDGGVILDDNRNPKGSDTRYYEQLGSIVRVGGIDLDYAFDTEVQTATNVAGQNDPPTIETTALNPNYTQNGDPSVYLFSGTVVGMTDTAAVWVGNNPLATTTGTRLLTVAAPNHGQVVGHAVVVSGAAAVGGYAATAINGSHTIYSVPDTDHFTIRMDTNATSTVAAGGGSAVALTAEQKIIALEVEVDGLSNGAIDQTNYETIAYAYTYVTSLDEESQPSLVSAGISWSPGQVVRLSGIAAPPAGRGINRIRIYRTQTADSGQTDLYYIGEITASQVLFDDNPETVPLQEAIGTVDFDPPPAALRGIIAHPGGIMAGFVGKEIFFCEPYKPHAWPSKYALAVDFPVVGLASIGTAIAVLTTGNPYLITGSHPDSFRMERVEVNYPCVAARSIVDMGYFAAYASTTGLVTISASEGAKLISEQLFTPRQWAEMARATFICSQHEGRYVISHDPWGDDERRQCTIIDLAGRDPFVVGTTWQPLAYYFAIGSGELYFLHKSRAIFEFDSVVGDFDRMVWKSKQFVLNNPTMFSCIMIDGEKIEKNGKLAVRVYADGRLVDTIGRANEVVRLRDVNGLARIWEVEVTGNFQVNAIWLATSPEEIASAG